jgi:hypothetical protein
MIQLIVGLAIVGFVCWLLVTYIPMPRPVRVAIIVLVALWILLRGLPLLGVPIP